MFFKPALISCIIMLAAGCSTIHNMMILENVKPWEKDVLAQDEMSVRGDKMEIYTDDHIYFSKEGASGGYGVGGGGCGCN